jgi:hypothetical protein
VRCVILFTQFSVRLYRAEAPALTENKRYFLVIRQYNTAPMDRSFFQPTKQQKIHDLDLAPLVYTESSTIFRATFTRLKRALLFLLLALKTLAAVFSTYTEDFLAPFSLDGHVLLRKTENFVWAFSELLFRHPQNSYSSFQLLEERNSLDMQTASRLDTSSQWLERVAQDELVGQLSAYFLQYFWEKTKIQIISRDREPKHLARDWLFKIL